MLLKLSVICVALFASQISESLAHSQECDTVASILMCTGNKALEVEVSTDDLTCQVSEAPRPKVRDDYTYTPGLGYHKFHTQAKEWNDARKVCQEEGGHLALVNSKEEEELLRNIFKKNLDSIRDERTKDEAFIGAHDLFKEGDWVTVLGEPLSSTGFVNWGTECYGPQPSGGQDQNCAALTHKCPGMDDTYCHMKLAFFCELPDQCS